jgi:hypothetical protein
MVAMTFETINSEAYIQYQDGSENWIQAEVVPNESIQIINGMNRVASNYGADRVRAVDSNSRLLDIL